MKRLLARGVEPGHVLVISNWTDDDKIAPLDPASNPLRREWGLEDRFVIGYSGNLGRTHEFETLLAAAERLRHNRDITFLFVGGGYLIPELAAAVSARGLNEVFRFIPYQKREILRCPLAVPDVHWVSLRPQMEGLMVPSKFLGAAAAGRPIIAITAQHGELAELLLTHDCGVAIEPGNVEALVKAITVFAADRKLCRAMGQRARQMLDTHFSRQQGLLRWREVLDRWSSTDGAVHH
jgi:colanic acid biosynthesis glycosyl transferase WcaI